MVKRGHVSQLKSKPGKHTLNQNFDPNLSFYSTIMIQMNKQKRKMNNSSHFIIWKNYCLIVNDSFCARNNLLDYDLGKQVNLQKISFLATKLSRWPSWSPLPDIHALFLLNVGKTSDLLLINKKWWKWQDTYSYGYVIIWLYCIKLEDTPWWSMSFSPLLSLNKPVGSASACERPLIPKRSLWLSDR